MRARLAATAAATAVILVAVAAVSLAQLPATMNYQVMLTDDADQPIADSSVQLVFRLYEQEAGGGPVWDETHNVTTNSIGVASVVLGSSNPMDILFLVPMWLQVEVDGEVMEPRRPLTAAPYAHFARIAEYAVDSEHLGSIPAESYTLDDDIYQPGSINDPANPLEWTKLKSVPSGFADGVDNVGGGDGHSLDAYDGDPQDVVFVNYDGDVLLGWFGRAKLRVKGPRLESAAIFSTASPGYANPAVVAIGDSCSGLAATGNTDGSYFTTTTPVGVAGFGVEGANGGAFYGTDTGHGAFCTSWGSGSALLAEAGGDGYSGEFTGGKGLHVEVSDGTYPSTRIVNEFTGSGSGFGDALYVKSRAGAGSLTWALWSECEDGTAARLEKNAADGAFAVRIIAPSASDPALDVFGTMTTSGPVAHPVDTSRGKEPVFSVASPQVEIIASGQGRLTDGSARVEFDRTFAEAITHPEDLRITATPIGDWSALYVKSIDANGFTLRAGAGATDVDFHWMAVGRAAGHERAPEVAFVDIDEERRLSKSKREHVESRRPERREPPEVITHYAE